MSDQPYSYPVPDVEVLSLDSAFDGPYLHHSYKSFSQQMQQRNDALFIYGHSLAENDEHILKKIARGKIAQMYVGLYGDPNSDSNKRIIAIAEKITAQRDTRAPLAVTYFDAASAKVWEPK